MQRLSRAFRIIHVIFLVLSLILLILSFKLSSKPENIEYYYRNGKIISHSWHNTFYAVSAIFSVVVIASALIYNVSSVIYNVRNKANKLTGRFAIWLMSIVTILLIAASAFVLDPRGSDAVADHSPKCFEFSDGSHTLVIEEKSYLLWGGGTVYQLGSDNKAEIIGNFNTDDGFRNNGAYDIEWFPDHAEIMYKYGSGDEVQKKLKVTFI